VQDLFLVAQSWNSEQRVGYARTLIDTLWAKQPSGYKPYIFYLCQLWWAGIGARSNFTISVFLFQSDVTALWRTVFGVETIPSTMLVSTRRWPQSPSWQIFWLREQDLLSWFCGRGSEEFPHSSPDPTATQIDFASSHSQIGRFSVFSLFPFYINFKFQRLNFPPHFYRIGIFFRSAYIEAKIFSLNSSVFSMRLYRRWTYLSSKYWFINSDMNRQLSPSILMWYRYKIRFR